MPIRRVICFASINLFVLNILMISWSQITQNLLDLDQFDDFYHQEYWKILIVDER